MRHRNALGIPIELEHDEIRVFLDLDVGAILALEVLGLAESFHTVWQRHADIAAVDGENRTLVGGAHFEYALKRIPWVFLKLLVTQAHPAICLVKLENDDFDFVSNVTELGWVLDFLFPTQV